MATVSTTGKSFTLPVAGTVYTMSTQLPALFTNIGTPPLSTNSSKAIVNLTIKSSSAYAVQIMDYTTGNYTDIDTIPVIGTFAIFSISGVSITDFRLRPTVANQAFYAYLSGEI